jgi:hypothetical protein
VDLQQIGPNGKLHFFLHISHSKRSLLIPRSRLFLLILNSMAALFTACGGYCQATSDTSFPCGKKYQKINKFQAATMTNEYLDYQKGLKGKGPSYANLWDDATMNKKTA